MAHDKTFLIELKAHSISDPFVPFSAADERTNVLISSLFRMDAFCTTLSALYGKILVVMG